MFLTAFAAALLGALVAPLLTAGVNRISEIELPEIPEITLPELPKEAVEEVRALESEYPWVKMAENVYSIIRQEVNNNKFKRKTCNNLTLVYTRKRVAINKQTYTLPFPRFQCLIPKFCTQTW